MARNTLEAVFGALGAGLTGYGRDVARRREEEQARLDRERQAERDRLADEVTVAGLLERGFGGEQEQRAQGQQRSRTALQMALQGATAGRGGMAPSMPMPTQVQQLAAQQARPQRTPVNVAGRQLSLLETALERAQRQRAEGMEEASLARQQELADEARRDAQRMREIAAQGENQLQAIERTASLRPPTPGEQNWRLRIPSASRQKLEQSESAMEQLESLRTAVQQNPSAVGAKSYLPGFFIDRRDPKGAAIRATIELIAGEIRNARFGGALTKTEAEFALRSLPDATQRPDVLLSRIDALQRFLESRRRSVFNTYGVPYEPLVPPPEARGDASVSSGGRTNVRGSAAERLRSGEYR